MLNNTRYLRSYGTFSTHELLPTEHAKHVLQFIFITLQSQHSTNFLAIIFKFNWMRRRKKLQEINKNFVNFSFIRTLFKIIGKQNLSGPEYRTSKSWGREDAHLRNFFENQCKIWTFECETGKTSTFFYDFGTIWQHS